MQNLIKYSKRQYVDSRKFLNSFFKCNSKNAVFRNINLNNEMNRLCLPVSLRFCIQIHKELNTIQSLLFKNDPYRIYSFRTLCNTRNFSTTSRVLGKNTRNEGSDNSSKDPDKKNEKIMILSKTTIFFLFCFLCISVLLKRKTNPVTAKRLTWDEFVKDILLKGEVEQIEVYDSIYVKIYFYRDAIFKGDMLQYKTFVTANDEFVKNLEERIRKIEQSMGIKPENGVPIIYINTNIRQLLSLVPFFVVLSIFLIFFQKLGGMKALNPMNFLAQKMKAKFTLVEPFSGKGVRFKDVAGLKEAKIEVMEFVDYLKYPERYKKLGAKVPKGALLLGPPGCGKTLLAKAVATESNVPFLSMNGSEFTGILGGLGASRVRDLFSEAKKRSPSIIYIDEIDAVGKKRSEGSIEFNDSESERTLNQLLVEMDGMTSAQDVIILGSTNRADVLDVALLRPGRFDRHILIDFPTMDERKQIFDYHLKSLSLKGNPDKYSGYLAYLTPGFSGADIANICNEAALHAAREKKKSVSGNDLLYAIDRTIGGMIKKNNPLTPSMKKVVAYHEAGHALVAWLLEHTDVLLKVTIVPRTNSRLGFAQYTISDQKLYSKEQLFQKICVSLGGRVAESIIFNEVSTGAKDDLVNVTKIAYKQVQQFGMSPVVGLISFDEEVTSTKNKKPYSKKLANVMDAEVRRIITEAYKTTEKLLLDNKDKLTLFAEALLEKETLTYDDVEKLLGPPPFGKKRLAEPTEFVAEIETQASKPTAL